MSTQISMPRNFINYKDDITPAAVSPNTTFKRHFMKKFIDPEARFSFINSTCDFRDVTDNKTTDTNSNLNFRDSTPLRAMNDDLCSEAERLKTFTGWPLDFMDKNVLAQTGMYYLGINDNVKCYFCEVEIGKWEFTDNPVTEHIRWSPNCPLLKRRSTNNIPLDAELLDKVLPPSSYDVCGRNDIIDVRPTAYAEACATESAVNSSNSFAYPDYPEYAIEAARIRSFSEWPRTMKQKPKELSEAGFFYTGVGDRVRCFSCGGGLKDWDECDDPWEQHALWLSNCPYLRLIKGKSYIDSVIRKYKTPGKADAKETSVEQSSEETKDKESDAKTSCDEKPIPDAKLCKICYAAEFDTAFLPCGHVVACAKCASSVTKCPMCREPCVKVVRVYFS